MKLHILSDLHIEFSDYKIPIQEADILVLAGDIGNGLAGLEYASRYKKDYKHIIYVSGNHEFYGNHLSRLSLELKDVAKEKNIILLDNNVVNIDGINFIGSTLWTDFRLYGDSLNLIGFYMNEAQNKINDFSQIRYASYWFNPSHSATLSIASQNFIEKFLDEQQEQTNVVITHHGPSKQSIHPKYQGSSINACFSNDLDHIVAKANLWIHGHTHDSMDYEIGKCRVVCNPRGYSKYQDKQENVNFKGGLVIEI